VDLKVRVTDIPVTGWDLSYDLTPEETEARLVNIEKDLIRFFTPVQVRLKLERTGNRILVRGSISTGYLLTCSLCLEEFNIRMSEEVFSVFTPFPEEYIDGEIAAEDLNEEYYEGEEIDLWPLIREYLFLGMPIKPACRDNCKGLCPICGQNLNKKRCDCSSQVGHPGFSKLKQLRDSLPKK